MNYIVVLFKNKERKKIINKFKTFERAQDFFNKKIEENKNVLFEKQVENANDCNFELCLLQKKDSNFDNLYVRDNLGRQVKIETDDPEYKIINVSNYKVEELVFDISENKKITIKEFIKKYLPKTSIKLLSRLNNKIVVQNDDKVNLFSLKNEYESKRFLESLNDYFFMENRIDSIFVIDASKEQKKYLYDILSKMGIDKQLLYRRSTTFKPR
jgi:hypothetical protein